MWAPCRTGIHAGTRIRAACLNGAGANDMRRSDRFREGDVLTLEVEKKPKAKGGWALLVCRNGVPCGRIDAATAGALIDDVRGGVLGLVIVCGTLLNCPFAIFMSIDVVDVFVSVCVCQCVWHALTLSFFLSFSLSLFFSFSGCHWHPFVHCGRQIMTCRWLKATSNPIPFNCA